MTIRLKIKDILQDLHHYVSLSAIVEIPSLAEHP